MGECCSTTLDQNTRYINKRMAEEKNKDFLTSKLLFLGPGGSGKSTIFKQLQWLHGDGFDEADGMVLKMHVYSQVITAMKRAIQHYKLSNTEVKENNNQQLQDAVRIIESNHDLSQLSDELVHSISYIWENNKQVSNVFEDMKTAQHKILDESTKYFWNELDRIKDPQYIPNPTDIINVRYRTIGVIEKKFTIQNTEFHIFDVGGQKSERKKWIHCFNEVKALIFVISLNCYNQRMFEDLETNAMVDSLELFDETINNKLFNRTDVILFLNKKDLFMQKICLCKITSCPAFQDFDAFQDATMFTSNPNDFEQTTSYIKSKFQERLRTPKGEKSKQIYTHLTCAMDRKNIENVIEFDE
eukprot:36842_1